MAAKKYTVTDGKLILHMQPDEDGWFCITSPTDPAMITQARSIEQAFVMARDAFATLAASRADKKRWNPAKRTRRTLVHAGV